MEFDTDQLKLGEVRGFPCPYGCAGREIIFYRPDPNKPSPPKRKREPFIEPRVGIAIIGAVGLVLGKAVAAQFSERGTFVFLFIFAALAAGLWFLLKQVEKKDKK